MRKIFILKEGLPMPILTKPFHLQTSNLKEILQASVPILMGIIALKPMSVLILSMPVV